MKFALPFLLVFLAASQPATNEFFAPAHRISGIGAARPDMSADLLEMRVKRMVESQTFGILRDSRAVEGARRVTSDPKLHAIFEAAAQRSGWPVTLLEAISYLESWGESNAQSPSGPKGVMQISSATARAMGLQIATATRYKVTKETVQTKTKSGKVRSKVVTRKTPYVVVVRDDRLIPDRAIPAAAQYLASMQRKFGGNDWAVFAYHCGEGCVAEMQELTRRAQGIPKDQISVERMFFSCSPAWNRELYQAIAQQMQRDYSPTYYFRILRAEELLALYRRDPQGFAALAAEYRSELSPGARAPHRLSVWLRRDDLVFHTSADIRTDSGRRLAKAFDRPAYFGYALDLPVDARGLTPADSPSALGALMYISFETRRLHEAMHPKGEKFKPLEVTALVQSDDALRADSAREALSHTSGQVFDIDYASLPPGEIECLRFVLDDMGWDGYLGFVEEGRENMHIGCAPNARDFFASVFQEGVGTKAAD